MATVTVFIPQANGSMMNYQTIPRLFEESGQKFPDNEFLKEKQRTQYASTSYAEAYREVCRTAQGLLAFGLKKGERVALISEGRNDWLISELAVLFSGGVCVPLSVKIEEPAIHSRYQQAIQRLYTPEGKELLHDSNKLAIASLIP